MASGRTMAFPAPSLRELSRPEGVTEGVSSDGSTGPMVCPAAIINSEIFEWLRSSGYTPSVSHSLDSSLREGAGMGWCHSTGCSLISGVAGGTMNGIRPDDGVPGSLSEGAVTPKGRD